MENKKIINEPLGVEFRASNNGATVLIETIKANKYLGYPSTYAACMSHSQYLTDTADMNSVKAAGACAAQVEKMGDDALKTEEANLQKGYPSLGIPPMAMSQPAGQPGTIRTTPAMSQPAGQPGTIRTTPASQAQVGNASVPCPCEEAAAADVPSPLPPTTETSSLEGWQAKDVQLEYDEEEREQISENLEKSDFTHMWWLNPKVDGEPYYGTEANEQEDRDYSAYLGVDLDSIAKTKKDWEKVDKKELDRDSKKDKVKHEKDAVKDDQSKINKLKKGKPSVKKSVEVHDLKKDQEFDKEDKIKYSKAGKPWEKTDEDELKKDSKKEKKAHEKDAVKDDKKQIKDLKKDIKEDKKSEKKG
jgi:hypothetical protein